MGENLKERRRPNSGTIRVTWMKCPNGDCKSHGWNQWDVDYGDDMFKCGACNEDLARPIFLSLPIVKKLLP
jgi:hypothetical protein